MVEFDRRDAEIVERRRQAYNNLTGVVVGDYVRFPCGTLRRVGYVWDEGAHQDVQTTDIGNFHLLDSGRCSFSGNLYNSIPADRLKPTEEKLPGKIWIFHHDCPGEGRAVTGYILFRVWQSADPAPEV